MSDPGQADASRQTCTPCRGTGKVISNLGGEQREMICPWCEGSGEFKPGHDAQDDAASEPDSTTGPGAESAQ